MNQLTSQERSAIVACLVEGTSLRATCRITGAAKKTVSRLAAELGAACQAHCDAAMVNLPCADIQCDEIWAFVGAKQKNVKTQAQRDKQWGDVWTWIAIDRQTKLIPAWYIGDRSAQSAYHFMRLLQARLANRVHLSTDGHHAYLTAVKAAFLAAPIDYGMLIKIYGDSAAGYSPADCIGARREPILGTMTTDKICTSHAERNNLTVRMSMRRFTRLTNAFSKSVEMHRLACALHFTHYNFCRIHQTLRCTPAMAAGITDRVWEIADLVDLLDASKALPLPLAA